MSKYSIDDATKIQDLRDQGMTWRQIAKELGFRAQSQPYEIYKKYSIGGSFRPSLMWLPADTAPIEQYVLAVDEHGDMDVAKRWPDGEWVVKSDFSEMAGKWKPTHWTQLPKGPKK